MSVAGNTGNPLCHLAAVPASKRSRKANSVVEEGKGKQRQVVVESDIPDADGALTLDGKLFIPWKTDGRTLE